MNRELNKDHMFLQIEEKFRLETAKPTNIYSFEDLLEEYMNRLDGRSKCGYEVDGLVITVNDVNLRTKLGVKSDGRPNGEIALKFPAQAKQTRLLDIEWSVGKVGTITGVGILEPIDLGVTVRRVSLHNMSIINELWNGETPRVGDVVEVKRAGDVIPHITRVIEVGTEGRELGQPTECPECDEPIEVEGSFLVCNNEFCSGRELGNLEKWINKIKDHFKVHCVGPEGLKGLYNSGLVKDVGDLYNITAEEVYNTVGGGPKSANNMLLFQQFKEIDLAVFLGALNLKGLGTSIWKLLIEKSEYNTIENILTITSTIDILRLGIEGLGETRCRLMVDGLAKKKELITKLLNVGIKPSYIKPISVDSNISGKTFVITGKLSMGRSEMKGKITSLGGTVQSGVSKKTQYLIIGENVGKTKTDKAKKCGTTIITEEQLMEMI